MGIAHFFQGATPIGPPFLSSKLSHHDGKITKWRVEWRALACNPFLQQNSLILGEFMGGNNFDPEIIQTTSLTQVLSITI